MGVFVIVLILLAAVLQHYMGIWALRSVTCELRAERYLIEPDQPAELKLILTNRSVFPILFLRVRCAFPGNAVLEEGQRGTLARMTDQMARFQVSCYMMPKSGTVLSVRYHVPARGLYRFSEVNLAAGDLFGLQEKADLFDRTGAMVVAIPKAAMQPDLSALLGGLMGECSVRRFIHPDPILTAGCREYTGREPFRSIAWTRSAASDRLMVKQYDHTAELRASVLLGINAGSLSLQEESFSLTRSVCEALERSGVAYSFDSCGRLFSSMGRLTHLDEGLGRLHTDRILEGLGRAEYGGSEELPLFLNRISLRRDLPESFVLILQRRTREAEQLAGRLESRTGAKVVIIAPEERGVKERGEA